MNVSLQPLTGAHGVAVGLLTDWLCTNTLLFFCFVHLSIQFRIRQKKPAMAIMHDLFKYVLNCTRNVRARHEAPLVAINLLIIVIESLFSGHHLLACVAIGRMNKCVLCVFGRKTAAELRLFFTFFFCSVAFAMNGMQRRQKKNEHFFLLVSSAAGASDMSVVDKWLDATIRFPTKCF